MTPNKKEEFLTIFSISLAMIAASVMIYMARSPSITGDVVLETGNMTVGIISLLILAGITTVISAIVTIHKLHTETEQHKRALEHNKSQLLIHPNMNLVHYIIEARRNGFETKEIAKKLKEQGWEKDIIKKYL